MAYYINAEDCNGCGICYDECPTSAIVQDGDVYTIDQEQCTECGRCYPACPVGAIVTGQP